MDCAVFRNLNQAEQVDLILKRGIFIGKRFLHKMPCLLYQVRDFYVEIRYVSYRKIIRNIFCFKSVRRIDPYLRGINIDDLFV
jgi:hypothetical protein